jgi:PKD repeat protein
MLATTIMFGQDCNANFGYTVGANNVVTMIDSSTSSCTILYSRYNYGDPQSGNLNLQDYPGSVPKHFYKNAGTYTICQRVFTGTSCNPCLDTLCKQITLPDTGSNCQAEYSYINNGNLYSFTNSSTADDSIASVYWDLGDGTMSNVYNPSHIYTYPYPINYIICLYIQTSNGCQSSICDTIMVSPSGINEYENNKSLTVSPNPFSTQTILQTDKIVKRAALVVYDVYGKQVRHISPVTIGDGQTITLQRESLPSGLYFIRLIQDNKTLSVNKLIITDN